jgi:DNA-binding NarL/FixJ family response regulator
MSSESASLSAAATAALEAIANGYTYEQILTLHPNMTYLDIFSAARDALAIIAVFSSEARTATAPKEIGKTLDEHRQTDPRAYEKWTEEEENALIELMKTGHTIRSAAELLQRKPSAIRSRLEKLNARSTDASIPV